MSILAPMLEDVYERMTGVTIECLPWQEFITKWDRKGMLFYLDPPYWDREADYGKGIISKDDFTRMANMLSSLKGCFVMSINNVEPTLNLFASYKMQEVELNYSIGKAKAARELIISNFP